ncbi:DOMON domain-containing protein, partial [Salmonella sp. s51228]|uniref:DOMON domain-containing protein n=1 Tax=Salmonella sp. s51228 TaxID=3159652 RepID=UPI00397F11F6
FNCTGCPAVYTTQSNKEPLPWYCLILSNDANVRIEYQLDRTNNEVNFRIYTCNFEVDDYIAFGLSGSPSQTWMVGGDVCVCRFDGDLKAPVCNDHHLSSRAQCATTGGSYDGACPDTILGGTDDCSKISIYREYGTTIFGFSRKLTGNDMNDTDIILGTEQYLIWAKGKTFPASTGAANERWVLRHAPTERSQASNPIKLDFNSTNDTCEYRYSCTSSPLSKDPWTIEPVCGNKLPSHGEIRAVIG